MWLPCRDSGVSVASGSAVINPHTKNTAQSPANRTHESASFPNLASRPLTVTLATVDLSVTNNFKLWTVPSEDQRTGTNTGITLNATVGCLLTNGRVRDATHRLRLPDGELEGGPLVTVVPGFRPALYDSLLASTAHSLATTVESNADTTAARLTGAVWHVTVDDLQLTSVSVLFLQICCMTRASGCSDGDGFRPASVTRSFQCWDTTSTCRLSAFLVPWLNIALCCFSVAGYSGSVRGPQYPGHRCLRRGSVAGAAFLPWEHSPLSRYV
jgi:hypothetical protein